MNRAQIDIGIVVPLKEEFRYVTEIAPQIEAVSYEGSHFYRLNFGAISSVCCLMDQMGPLAALQATHRLLAFADIKLLVLLGTAGTLDDDVSIGDVVVASEVNDFQANSRAESAGDTYEVRYSGRHWPLEFKIREAITHFEFSGRDIFDNWQLTATEDYNAIESKNRNNVCNAPPSLHLGAIASGNIVAASDAFKQEVKRINRKFLAIDMEAAGVASAASERIHPLPFLVIRGISDPANETKAALEKESKKVWRRYCVRNASSLLRALLNWDGFLRATGLKEFSGIPNAFDLARQLVMRLKGCIGGPWAVGVAFGIYSYGPQILDSGIAAADDLNRLQILNPKLSALIDSLNEVKNQLVAKRDVQAAATGIEKIVTEYRMQLGSTNVINLFGDFDKVVFEILCPDTKDDETQSLLLEADRIEEDVGPDAVVEFLRSIVDARPLLRERFIDALARADQWDEIAKIICKVDITSLSRSELENSIFAFGKLGMEAQATRMIRQHESHYADKAAKIFRDRMKLPPSGVE